MNKYKYVFFDSYYNYKQKKIMFKFHPWDGIPYFPGRTINITKPCIVKVSSITPKGNYGFINGEITNTEPIAIDELIRYCKKHNYDTVETYEYVVEDDDRIFIARLRKSDDSANGHNENRFVCKINGTIEEMFFITDLISSRMGIGKLLRKDNSIGNTNCRCNSFKLNELHLKANELTNEDIESILITSTKFNDESFQYKKLIKNGKVVAIYPLKGKYDDAYFCKSFKEGYPYKERVTGGIEVAEAIADSIEICEFKITKEGRTKYYMDNVISPHACWRGDFPVYEQSIFMKEDKKFIFKVFSGSDFIASMLDYPELVAQVKETKERSKKLLKEYSKITNTKDIRSLKSLAKLSLKNILDIPY